MLARVSIRLVATARRVEDQAMIAPRLVPTVRRLPVPMDLDRDLEIDHYRHGLRSSAIGHTQSVTSVFCSEPLMFSTC
jgi:hypothetical protein